MRWFVSVTCFFFIDSFNGVVNRIYDNVANENFGQLYLAEAKEYKVFTQYDIVNNNLPRICCSGYSRQVGFKDFSSIGVDDVTGMPSYPRFFFRMKWSESTMSLDVCSILGIWKILKEESKILVILYSNVLYCDLGIIRLTKIPFFFHAHEYRIFLHILH